MYEDSIVPENWPGGGGFSVTKLSLETLYELHLRCRNWWTTSNQELPLCRYLGCQLRLYQCEDTDYIVKIQTEFPPKSNKLTYASCQPYMMLMSRGKIVVPSRKNERRRKPYKKVFVKPPPQLKTEWYFQVDMYKTALMVIHAAACNLQDMFIKPFNNSTTVTFKSLNTQLIQNREMNKKTNVSWNYKTVGTVNFYFYRLDSATPPTVTSQMKLGDLVPLTQLQTNYVGTSYLHRTQHTEGTFQSFISSWSKYWGNPFNEHNQDEEHKDFIYISQASPESIRNQITTKNLNENDTWDKLAWEHQYTLTKLDEDFYINIQYTPQTDTGQDASVYLLPNTTGHGWEPPTDEDQILSGFPAWISLYGFTDFQIKLKKLTNIDSNSILVIKFTNTRYKLPIVPINNSFILGQSPYEQDILPQDKLKWFPQFQYQTIALNEIVKTGPATPQNTTRKSENIKIFYTFYWKWGGSPPKHINVENPSLQDIYPVPGNQYAPTSLQNPAQAPETVLYSFDFRHGNLTNTAYDRITNNWETQSIITSITEPTTSLNLKKAFQQLQETEKEEQKTQENLQQQLNSIRLKQHNYRQQIISLLTQM